ncbi:MAG: hypothetical protein ACRDR6_29645 [Pseudonocardiaceae bacterium]
MVFQPHHRGEQQQIPAADKAGASAPPGEAPRTRQVTTPAHGVEQDGTPQESTLLKVLLKQRHWQKHETFAREWNKVAKTIDPVLVGSCPSRSQFYRWLSGQIGAAPHPDACRILEAIFPGYSVEQLFQSARTAQDHKPITTVPPLTTPPLASAAASDTSQAPPQPVEVSSSSDLDRLAATGYEAADAQIGSINDISSLLVANLALSTAIARSILGGKGPGEQLTTLRRLVDGMKRRDLLQLFGWTVTTAFASPLFEGLDSDEQERLVSAIAKPERVDAQVITHIESILFNALRNNDKLGPRSALHTVLAQQEILQAMATDCPDKLLPRLLSVLSNSLRIAGWVSFNADDLSGTRRYYEQARTVAYEAQDLELATFVLANLSQAAESSTNPATAVDYAVAAQSWATRANNARACAFASDIAACAYAAMGDYNTTMRHLENTQTYLSEFSDQSPSAFYSYSEALHTGRRGQCLLKLGRTAQAVQVIDESLNLYGQDDSDPCRLVNVAVGRLELSEAHVQAGDIDQGATILAGVADFISQNRADRLVKRVHGIRGSLQPWSDSPVVKQLDDQLHTSGLRS